MQKIQDYKDLIEPEFLIGEQLDQFKNLLRAYVFKSYGQRSFSFTYLNNYEEMAKWRCRNCSRSFLYFKTRKKYYCSDACAHKFFLQYDFTTIQDECLKRAHYRCQKCHISILQVVDEQAQEHDKKGHFIKYLDYRVVREYINTKWYDIDHIQEIATGKTQYEQASLFFDLNNLQVLCKECHKKKTAKFLSERFSKVKKELILERKGLRSKQLIDFI